MKDPGRKEERTEVWHGIRNIARKSWNILSSAKISSDYCHDSSSPATLTTTPQFLDMIIQLNSRGVRQRFITDITKENTKYCKELAKYVELRHLDGITGNFGIVDRKEYGAASNIYQNYEQQAPAEFIYSNVKGFVEQQWYFFDTLWNKAIPAKQRIKEIEKGAKREFVETIRHSYEIQRLSFDIVKRAEEEILILFSTANAFRRQEKAGALELLKEAALQRAVKIRILVPIEDDDNKAMIIAANEKMRQLNELGIGIRQIKKEGGLYPLQHKLTMLIVDQSVYLTVEQEGEIEEGSEEAIELATYSNIESSVFAYLSIFENLWMHAEMMGGGTIQRQRSNTQAAA